MVLHYVQLFYFCTSVKFNFKDLETHSFLHSFRDYKPNTVVRVGFILSLLSLVYRCLNSIFTRSSLCVLIFSAYKGIDDVGFMSV